MGPGAEQRPGMSRKHELHSSREPVLGKQTKVGGGWREKLNLFFGAVSAAAGIQAVHTPTVSAEPLPRPPGITLQVPSREVSQPSPFEVAEVTQRLIGEANRFSVDDIGYRISNAFQIDGLWYIAYQGAMLQDNPQLGVVLANSLDILHERRLDPYLEAVYQIPPHEDIVDNARDTDEAFRIRADRFRVARDIVQWVADKRKSFETGVFTSQQKNYGPFDTVRLQRYAVQKWVDGSGLIQRILVGDVVAAVGRTIPGEKIIPDEALLDKPDLGSGGGTVTTPPRPETPPGLVLQKVGETIKGNTPGTEISFYTTTDSPIKPRVERSVPIAVVADTYTPGVIIKVNLVRTILQDIINRNVKFNSSSSLAINNNEGKTIATIALEGAVIKEGNTYDIFWAIPENDDQFGNKGLQFIKSSPAFLEVVERGISRNTGRVISELGGYSSGGRLAPEVSMLESTSQNIPPAIRLEI